MFLYYLLVLVFSLKFFLAYISPLVKDMLQNNIYDFFNIGVNTNAQIIFKSNDLNIFVINFIKVIVETWNIKKILATNNSYTTIKIIKDNMVVNLV